MSMIALLAGSPPNGQVTPIFAHIGAPSTVDNTATEYAQFAGRVYGWTPTYNSARTVSPTTGFVSKLYVEIVTAPGAGKSWTYTLYVNGVASALTVTISDAGLSANDTTHSVAVTAGDTLAWAAIPASTPTAPTNLLISCQFLASDQSSMFIGGDSGNVSNSASNYHWMWGSGTWNASEAISSSLMPTAGTVSGLRMVSSASPGAGKSYAFTVYKNGSPTALTCTIADTNSTASDLVNSVSFVAGDTLSLQCTPSGTPTATSVRHSMKMTPVIGGESIFPAQGTAPDTGVAAYFAITTAPSAGGATPAITSGLLIPVAGKLRKLYTSMDVAAGAAKSRTSASYINSGLGTLTAAMSGASAITANDTTHEDTLAIGDKVWYVTTPAGTPAATTWYKFGAVIFVQP